VVKEVGMPFFWNFTFYYLNGTILYNNLTDTYTQTLNKITFFDCNVSNASQVIAINFTPNLEVGDTPANFTFDFEGTFILYTNDTSINTTKTYDLDQISNVQFCIDPDKIYQIEAMVEYTNTSYGLRNYYFANATVSNITQNISLYLLESSLDDPITVSVVDGVGDEVPNVYIHVQRYYVGEDNYKLVAMGRTDEDGEDLIYLQKNLAWYKFSLVLNGVTEYLDTVARKLTEDDLELNIEAESLADYMQEQEGISYNLYNTSEHIVLTFTNPSGSSFTNCLRVFRKNATSEGWVCNTCLSTATGTISCLIGNDTGVYFASFTSSGSPERPLADLILERVRGIITGLGKTGLFGAFFIVLTLGLIGAWIGKVSTTVIFTIMGLLTTKVLGLLTISWYYMMAITIVGIIIIVLSKS